jgi:hypothetical protein
VKEGVHRRVCVLEVVGAGRRGHRHNDRQDTEGRYFHRRTQGHRAKLLAMKLFGSRKCIVAVDFDTKR